MSYYPEPATVIGRSAYVTVAIPGGTKAGEVIIRVSGGTESYIAFADQPVEIGRASRRGGRPGSAYVVR